MSFFTCSLYVACRAGGVFKSPKKEEIFASLFLQKIKMASPEICISSPPLCNLHQNIFSGNSFHFWPSLDLTSFHFAHLRKKAKKITKIIKKNILDKVRFGRET